MNLNSEQTAAVQSREHRITVTAGPGSGKTGVLVERIRELLNRGETGIVAITFTNNAADELQQRLGDVAGKVEFIGTLHSWLLMILRRDGRRIGLSSRLTVIDDEAAKELLELKIHENRYRGPKMDVTEVLARPQHLLGSIGPFVGPDLVAAAVLIAQRDQGLLDFAGILSFGLHLIKSVGVTVNHLLVDEAQDASPIDWEIYERTKAQNLFAVGDPDQACYGWRGAAPDLFTARATNGGYKSMLLESNYRSDRGICQAANNLIEHNEYRVMKLIAPLSEADGTVEAHLVEDEYAQGKVLVAGIKESPDPAQCAVLCRNNWQVRDVADTLKAAGVPVREEKRSKAPTDWPFARAAVSFLANPFNDFLAYRVILFMRGVQEAQRARSEAAKAMRSINETAGIVRGEVPVQDVPVFLTRMGIRIESVEAVRKAAEGKETLTDLTLALAQDDLWLVSDATAGVTVCTIHGAKGREWDAVWLPWWNQQNFPGRKQGAELAEERRLAFIGITRAKHKVTILSTKTARMYAQAKRPDHVEPSQFVHEAGLDFAKPLEMAG